MELVELLEQLRTRYVSQYEVAYNQEIPKYDKVTPEVAFEISDGVFKNLYVADLIGQRAGSNTVIEVSPTRRAYGGNATVSYGGMNIRLGRVAWDDMVFSLEPISNSLLGFENWFERWQDIDGLRTSNHNLFSEVIHTAVWLDDGVSIDFGSAPVASIMELLSIFRQSGVQEVSISSSRN